MGMLSTAMGYGRDLPAPHAPNDDPLEPCARASCAATKRYMLALAQRVEELTVERDALRWSLDGAADWTPIGGEAVMDDLTATELRIVEVLLRAGRDATSGEFKTVRHDRMLRAVWGDAYRGENHLLRVNVARIREKFRPHDWGIVTRFGYGYRLAPHDPDRPGTSRPFADAERAEIVALRAGGLAKRAIARRARRDVGAVRRLLLAADAGAPTTGGEGWAR